jgi:hypothetical protein
MRPAARHRIRSALRRPDQVLDTLFQPIAFQHGADVGRQVAEPVMQDVFSCGRYAILDFGPGEAQYKATFATHRQEFEDVYLLRPTLRHRLLASLHYRLGNLSSDIGAVLERYGLKKRIKNLIRAAKG